MISTIIVSRVKNEHLRIVNNYCNKHEYTLKTVLSQLDRKAHQTTLWIKIRPQFKRSISCPSAETSEAVSEGPLCNFPILLSIFLGQPSTL